MTNKRPIVGLQLYTLRTVLGDDTAGVLRQVAEMGYESVELAGFGNLSPAQFKAALDASGLQVTASHTSLDAVENDFDGVTKQAQMFGYSLVGLGSVPAELRGSRENWIATARRLNDLGKKLRDEAGLTFFYHNHAFEFEEKFDGEYGLDLLYENSDPQYLQAELDSYWVQKGGENPTAYLKKYAGRVPILHIKDMREDGDFGEVGEGVLDWSSIFAAAEAGGVAHYIVEQDTCPGNPLDSIKISIDNLKRMGKLD
jgi:sugar phosphate isomerase/epimerase